MAEDRIPSGAEVTTLKVMTILSILGAGAEAGHLSHDQNIWLMTAGVLFITKGLFDVHAADTNSAREKAIKGGKIVETNEQYWVRQRESLGRLSQAIKNLVRLPSKGSEEAEAGD